MTTTTVPPFGRGVLATGKRVGRHFHAHVLGLAIIRDQLQDGDAMLESADGPKVVRMRTELQRRVPRPGRRLTRAEIAAALASQDVTTVAVPVIRPRATVTPLRRESIEPSTARVIFGLPFRRPM